MNSRIKSDDPAKRIQPHRCKKIDINVEVEVVGWIWVVFNVTAT
jgi:hypothetical protein